MKPTPLRLGLAVINVLSGLLLCALIIVVALALRIVYETLMLPVRVYRAERRPAPVDDGMEMDDTWARPGIEPDVPWPRTRNTFAEPGHRTVAMPDDEAYPASSGIKCARCGTTRLGWLGAKPTPIDGPCRPVHAAHEPV